MASHVNSVADEDVARHQERINHTQKLSKKLQHKTLPAQLLDPRRFALQKEKFNSDATEADAVAKKNYIPKVAGRYPQAGYELGHCK